MAERKSDAPAPPADDNPVYADFQAWLAGVQAQRRADGVSSAVRGGLLMILGRERAEQEIRDLIAHERRRWISLAEAELLTSVNRGTISRAIAKGQLASNGQKGKGRVKVDLAAVVEWLLERAKKIELRESDASVEKLFERVKKLGKNA